MMLGRPRNGKLLGEVVPVSLARQMDGNIRLCRSPARAPQLTFASNNAGDPSGEAPKLRVVLTLESSNLPTK
jgi:hypothetical protein